MEKKKKCNRCKAEKPLSEFRKNPRYKDGRLGKCKACEDKRANELKLNAVNAELYFVHDKFYL